MALPGTRVGPGVRILRIASIARASTAELLSPCSGDRKSTVLYKRNDEEVVFTITDEGAGFDASHYLEFDPERAFDPNGRGIAMAGKLAFSRIEYRRCGNQVVATIKLKKP